MSGEYDERRGLTFGQAEGAEPLPRQLALGEVSQGLRVRLLKVLLESLGGDRAGRNSYGTEHYVGGGWGVILFDKHVYYDERFPDEYSNSFKYQAQQLSNIIKQQNYVGVFGTVQYILSHPRCPNSLSAAVDLALSSARAAYRVVDRKLIVPMASEAEGQAITTAFADLKASEFNGARQHLSEASKLLTAGSWAPSVRESIFAVEAAARLLEPTADTLGPALSKLARAEHIHEAMKKGFGNLYGYTSDQPGIRHPLLDDGDAKVDETDAIYMFGACASFVSYLIGKGRAAGLIG